MNTHFFKQGLCAPKMPDLMRQAVQPDTWPSQAETPEIQRGSSNRCRVTPLEGVSTHVLYEAISQNLFHPYLYIPTCVISVIRVIQQGKYQVTVPMTVPLVSLFRHFHPANQGGFRHV